MEQQDPLLAVLPEIKDEKEVPDHDLLIYIYRAVREMVNQLYKLKETVYGNGEVGLDERIRNLERSTGLIIRVGGVCLGIVATGIGVPLLLALIFLIIKVIAYVYPLL